MVKRLNFSEYPGLDPADSGKLPNAGYGRVENVRAHSIEGGATALLASDITVSQTSFEVDDGSRFPAAAFIVQAASEKIFVGARTGNVLSPVTRGYGGTAAAAHGKGRTVFEVKTEYVYLLSAEPVRAIEQVYVDGIRQTSGYAAYTGKAGDEHPSYPGRAVIAFSAEAEILRQRNLDAGEYRTVEVEAQISAASHRELTAGATVGAPLGVKTNQRLWAAFTGSGEITKQTYTALVKNLNAGDGVLMAVIKDLTSGETIRRERLLVQGTETFSLEQEGGDWATEFSLLTCGHSGSFEVYYMKKTVTVMRPPEDEAYEKYFSPCRMLSFRGAGMEKTPALKPEGKTLAWAAYPGTSLGEITSQNHFAELYNPGASRAKVRLGGTDEAGNVLAFMEQGIGADATETVEVSHEAGGWNAMTRLVLISGEVRVNALSKEVSYIPEGGEAEKPLSTSSARVVIGEEVTADAEWTEDATGDYGGAGTLIERPDFVIKHFIVERMGFALSEIDVDSFWASGASYASAITGGYKFGFLIDEEIRPSEFLRRLAFECRSKVRYDRGKWYLNYLPDAAPSPVKTVTKDELAGRFAKFRFMRTPVLEVANEIAARFRRNYSRKERESAWLDVLRAEDAPSKAKYGTYKADIEFAFIRKKPMAEHVLDFILSRRKEPRLTVEFPVFWENFDLREGDTVEIENPLYGARKFYIESIRRTDKFRAEIRAWEW